MKPTAPTLIVLLLAALTTGCTTVRESFPDRTPEQVWTALVAVAETPDYDDPDPARRWFVKENRVWVDEENARIEIYRELDRVLRRASAKPLRQQRTWKFQILLEPVDPPRAAFVSRGWGLPTRAAEEGDRFFADVWDLLTDMYLEAESPPRARETAPIPALQEPVDAAPQIVDIDALEPGRN